MNKKKLGIGIAALLLLLVAAAAFVLLNYHVVDFRLYAKNAQHLDLRGQDISLEHYEALESKLPGAEIRWDVPFQNGLVKDDATEITVTTLTAADVAMLDYLTDLAVVNAQNCEDYAQLVELQKRHPEAQVHYDLVIEGQTVEGSVTRLEIGTITQEGLELLPYLTKLERVVVSGAEDLSLIGSLESWCRERGIACAIIIGGQEISNDAQAVTLSGATDADLALLVYLPELKDVYIQNPQASPEALLALAEACPQANVRWEVEICGLVFDQDTVEVDLSQISIDDLTQVETQMEYLPNAEKVIFGLCGFDKTSWGKSKAKVAVCNIDNEDMSAYRERVRDQYKVAWTVRLGPDMHLRTDKDNFMPGHQGMGRLYTDHAYNLRYCEDMVCLDIGHMTLKEVDFLEFMPHLKYLILAHTEVSYIDAIQHCKELVFLELDWSLVKDYTPLLGCTALEDLNIGKTHADITPILQMTWLKNLWMVDCSTRAIIQARETLTNTNVMSYGDTTVGFGWRKLQNYYDMRDALGMYYMNQ